jgi:aryl-alcohol dehydrogenase-like predicted oxidoreductase
VGDAAVDRLYTTFRTGGGSVFDTAHCYAFWLNALGQPERQLGELVRKHERNRGDVFIVTKGGHIGVPPGYPRPDRYIAPEVLERDVAESLERLNCGPIDLYLLHRDDPRVPAEEHLAALQPAIRRGDIKSIGVSNWPTARIEAANAFARKQGYTPFITNQVRYNLAVLTHPESGDPTITNTTKADLDWYTRNRFHMMAFSATANGYFSGKGTLGGYDNPTSQSRREAAQAIASTRGVNATQIALAWLLAHPFPIWPTFFTASPDHLTDALRAMEIRLTAEEVKQLM